MKTFPVPCTKEEINRIIEASIGDDFCYMLFMVARTTGRRLGEYVKVKVKDVDFEKNIMRTWVLKRRVPVQKEAILSDQVKMIIKSYVIKNKLDLEDFLFTKISYRQIQNKIKSYSKKANVDHNVSFHNFRHYFITELVRQGWSYDKIAKLTGHSSVGTLVHYDHAVASDIKDDALEALKKI